ncbi:exodeoxyribonuclease V subunit gamma [Alteromonas sp. CYL-A6]|uniref:exodeoxyribonuclease V subunit gamma n=1 Tax=Alteromonas nitratireducens TaxID=3390813 RepID=UPI0034BD2A1E
MLALYPSNRLEHLSFLLSTLLTQQPGQVFQPETILVESPGMQHWLNMALASRRGIAMNLNFPLPVRFMWDTARQVLGDDMVPTQSPYRREVLIWRIDALLQSDTFTADGATDAVRRYWQSREGENAQAVQRLQLAGALADVFEQYLLYRPEWLMAWERGEAAGGDSDMARWQAALWRELTRTQPLHPALLHQRALAALREGKGVNALPSRIIVFAINTMAPQLVSFFDALSEHTDIHIFHLNPSVNYWGEAKGDKEQARLLRKEGIARWMQEDQGNPFLGNLGKQGRDLFNLLTALDSFEVSAFDVPPPASEQTPDSLLAAIQTDIFHAARPLGHAAHIADKSVQIISAHNGLREVQALHDHLLAWLDEDARRRPSDIVVMCPAIERYAPLIDAVFYRVGTPPVQNDDPPRIPCSIADRAPLDAEPLVAAFIALLSLPDSRFGVADIIDYLRLDAMQKRFSLNQDDVELMTFWLQEAHVHWGLDAEHKSSLTGSSQSATYSWWWGLRRLITGMACEDQPVMTDDLLTVPHVEGQQAVVLGKLMRIVDTLQNQAQQLAQPRTATQWHATLNALRDACFAPDDEQADVWDSISKATAMIEEHCNEAGYASTLTLGQVRDVLLRRFSSPDAGNHFMTGQVTFCSMLPMRSIPFKKVCILGLNDGEFPRQSVPASVDLMARDARRQGDRSRRLEDRYLFLEAIISAREALYLSYQGSSDRDNSPRQPSLVLREFIQTLVSGYGIDEAKLITTLPLHPFSASAFSGALPSYEKGWLRLAERIEKHQRDDGLSNEVPKTDHKVELQFTSEAVARWFTHPLKHYANRILGVYLEEQEHPLDNAEPFAESALTRYHVLDAMTAPGQDEQTLSQFREQVIMQGDLPDTPLTMALLSQWQGAAGELVSKRGLHDTMPTQIHWEGQHIRIDASAYEGADAFTLHHVASQNVTRKLNQFFTQLCLNAAGYTAPLHCYYLRWEKGEHQVRCASWAALPRERANTLLLEIESLMLLFQKQPVPAFADLMVRLQKTLSDCSDMTEPALTTRLNHELDHWLTTSSPQRGAPAEDTYLNWFYPSGVTVEVLPLPPLCSVYGAMANAVKDKKQ